LFCAGVTVFRALKKAKVSSGQRLAVFGVGGLGHLAVQIGAVLGADVTAIDISGEKLELAKSLGASTVLNTASTNVVKELRGKGGVHAALVASAARAAYETAFYCCAPNGNTASRRVACREHLFPANPDGCRRSAHPGECGGYTVGYS
jgi:propanol-preferring alcohol dehydrogenase